MLVYLWYIKTKGIDSLHFEVVVKKEKKGSNSFNGDNFYVFHDRDRAQGIWSGRQ